MKITAQNKTDENETQKSDVLKKITVALIGNPNSGKTTLFNALTGSHQHVGNYPGVTVEKKSGRRIHKGYEITIVDLPGTYSLSAYSLEEKIARDFIVNDKPEVVVDVIDTTNLERNLYLAVQILELGSSMVLALNMFDELGKSNARLNTGLLSELLGAITVPTVASHEKGIVELLDAIIVTFEQGKKRQINVNYGIDMENAISAVINELEDENPSAKFPKRWIALKLLENDDEIRLLLGHDHKAALKADELRCSIEGTLGNDPEFIAADQRYGFIAGLIRETVQSVTRISRDTTEKIDNVLANRVLGLPIFLFMMWAAFQLTFKVGAYPMSWMGTGIGYLARFLSSILPDGLIQSFIVDGIIGGVGGVIVFLPNILLLFLAIAFLEDSGYMARAAFIMDKVMHLIGLHGKSFVPMLIGFGCNVPAIMATRTLESPKDRLTTMLVVPLISCGARLPIYILLAGAFFPQNAGNVIFLVYLIGIFMAIIMALVFKTLLFHGPSMPFVMELPPYRFPTLKSVLLHMWRRAFMYLKKAGTVILAASVIIWLATSIPITSDFSKSDRNIPSPDRQGGNNAYPDHNIPSPDRQVGDNLTRLEHSLAGHFGKIIEPAIRPIGFDWRIGIALTGGFAAKEIVVATLGTIYAVEDSSETSSELRKALREDPSFTPLSAFCLMIFVLLYSPCIPAITVIYHEAGSLKWSLFTVAYTTTLAWIVSFSIYQIGKLVMY